MVDGEIELVVTRLRWAFRDLPFFHASGVMRVIFVHLPADVSVATTFAAAWRLPSAGAAIGTTERDERRPSKICAVWPVEANRAAAGTAGRDERLARGRWRRPSPRARLGPALANCELRLLASRGVGWMCVLHV